MSGSAAARMDEGRQTTEPSTGLQPGSTSQAAASILRPSSPVRIVSLLTDFGQADAYVGIMKAVILARAPRARLVDLTHEVPPHDIARAAFLLYTAAPYFPPGSVHLAVVDPGVGSRRRPIAIATERAFYVGPDNGLFTYVLARDPLRAAVELREPRFRLTPVSDTFHGRDIFAPAAAHLASGGELGDLGPPVSDLVRLPPLRLEVSGAAIQGAVLHADRFGNAITSIGPLAWEGEHLVLAAPGGPLRFSAASAVVEVGGERLRGIQHTYANAAPGALIALVGSHAHLEIALREGSAARYLNLGPGDPITIVYAP